MKDRAFGFSRRELLKEVSVIKLSARKSHIMEAGMGNKPTG